MLKALQRIPLADQTSALSAHPIYIYHDGIYHFTALQGQVPRPIAVDEDIVMNS